MIVFDLECDAGHGFEGWFDSTGAYERQRERGLLECPVCGTKSVVKRLSAPRLNLGAPAPAVAANGRQAVAMSPAGDEHARLAAAQTAFYQHLRQLIERSVDVGEKFADEARRIH